MMKITRMLVKSAFAIAVIFLNSCAFDSFNPFSEKLSPNIGRHYDPSLPVRTVRTTSYSHREKELGNKYGALTASGRRVRYGRVRSAAADWSRYPLGTRFKIVGQPYVYVVEDYGRSLVGTGTIDIYKPTLRMMRSWGTRYVKIQVLEWGSYKASSEILKGRLHYDHVRRMYNSIRSKS